MASEISEKSEILTLKFPLPSVVFSICFLITNFDSLNDTSDTFFLLNGAYKPKSFWKICGRAMRTPVKFPSAILLIVTPLTVVTPTTENSLRSPDGGVLTLINRASASFSLFMIIISFSFIDPNVFPAHLTTPEEILNESEGLIPLIGTPCSTKSPLKSILDPCASL